eukprot:m.102977 g.102977  ORF g.102977 m.102977 type:complete len:908 (+) comp12605_c1_seq1:100-2823(+)
MNTLQRKKLHRKQYKRSSSIEVAKNNGRTLITELLDTLKLEVGKETFMIVTKFLFSAIHHIVNEPNKSLNRKFTTRSDKIKDSCRLECMQDFLSFATLDLEGEFFVLEGEITKHELSRLRLAEEVLEEKRKEEGELEAWAIFLTDISRGKNIGAGAFGEVFEATWRGQEVAVKSLKGKVTKKMKREFFGEADIMKSLDHKNVLSLIGIVNKKPYMIVMEKMETNLQDHLRLQATSLSKSLNFAQDIACGIEYLHHTCNIIHCDIAARNVLVSDMEILKIADFGQSRLIGSEECDVTSRVFPIPVRWSPPETWEKRIIEPTMDIWAFGITFYEIMTGGLIPYSKWTIQKVKKEVTLGYRLKCPPECPENFYSLMHKTWSINKDNRPSIGEIVESLHEMHRTLSRDKSMMRLQTIRGTKAGDAAEEEEDERGEEKNELVDDRRRKFFRQRTGGMRLSAASARTIRRARGLSQAGLTPFSFFTQKVEEDEEEESDKSPMPSRFSSRRATLKRKPTLSSNFRKSKWFQGRRTIKRIRERTEPALSENGDFAVHETGVTGEFYVSVLWDIPIHIRLWQDSEGGIDFNGQKFNSLIEFVHFYENSDCPMEYAGRKICLVNPVILEEDNEDNLTNITIAEEREKEEEGDKEGEEDSYHFFMGCQSPDSAVGRQLYAALLETPPPNSNDEVSCFLDMYDLVQVPDGDSFSATSKPHIDKSKVFIALISEETIKQSASDPKLFAELEHAISRHKQKEMEIIPVFIGQKINIPHPSKPWKSFEVYDEFDVREVSHIPQTAVGMMTHRSVVEYLLKLGENGFHFNPFEEDCRQLGMSIVEKASQIVNGIFCSDCEEKKLKSEESRSSLVAYVDKQETIRRRREKFEKTFRKKDSRSSSGFVNLGLLSDSFYEGDENDA